MLPENRTPPRQGACADLTRDVLDVWRSVYLEELGWFDESSCAIACDNHWSQSTYIVAYLNKEPVGSIRIVVASIDETLPVERFCALTSWIGQQERRAELTRVMVKPEYRKVSYDTFPSGIYRSMLDVSFNWCLGAGCKNVVLNVRARGEPNSIIRSLEEYGSVETNIIIPDEFDPSYPSCTPVIIPLSDGSAACKKASAVHRATLQNISIFNDRGRRPISLR